MSIEDMSDFQINKAVAEALGMLTDKDLLPARTLDFNYNERYPNNVWAGKPDEAWEQVCYTHTPEDAWPVIAENKIAVMPNSNDTWKAGNLPPLKTVGWANFTSEQENPLRAAMIVFLKMKEHSNANNSDRMG